MTSIAPHSVVKATEDAAHCWPLLSNQTFNNILIYSLWTKHYNGVYFSK